MQQLAHRLRVSAHVVYYWIERQVIQARKLDGQGPLWITLIPPRSRNCGIGCALQGTFNPNIPTLDCGGVHYEVTVEMPSCLSLALAFGINITLHIFAVHEHLTNSHP